MRATSRDSFNESAPDPRERRDEELRARRAREAAAEEERRELKRQLADLTEERLKLRMAASDSAGAIGLQYCAESNNFVRIVRSDDGELRVAEPVPRPEPLAPLEAEGQPSTDKPAAPKAPSKVPDAVLWVFVVFVGWLVGLGLLTLVGFSFRRDAWVPWAGLVLGVCVLGGLKILVSSLWSHVGRQSALDRKSLLRYGLAATVTAGGCALDAHLGALAMREYILARELSTATVPPYGQLFVLALAVTCPILLASGVRAYMRGKAEPTVEERLESQRMEQRRKHEAAVERNEAARHQHHAALAEHAEATYGDRVAALAKADQLAKQIQEEREEEWQAMKGNPEFRCLQGLISQIGVLTKEIEERHRKLTGLEISAGHDRTRQRREEDKRTGSKPPWVENHAAGEAREAAESEEGGGSYAAMG